MADPLTYLFGLEQFDIKFGLGNITALVEGLGHPERAFRAVHVAGTNGKGSVTAMVDAALRAAGHRSARYTSPHLIDLSERFVVDGRPVAHDTLVAAVADVRDCVERLRTTGMLPVQPTFFEVTTAVAFELFRRGGVEIAVIEAGLGGRLDATNVLTPMVTAITSIAFDHEQHLGCTLRDIATEKAGIIKPNVPVVVGDLQPEATAAIEGVARERDAPVVHASSGVDLEQVRLKRDATDDSPFAHGSRIQLRTLAHDYGDATLALPGQHQIDNAIVAVRVLEVLDASGVAVPPPAIIDGLVRVSWPGRLEHRRLGDGREVILDAAHNPAGAAALAAYLAQTAGEQPPLVFAVMRDKNVREMLRLLVPAVGALVLTHASTARSAVPEELAKQAVSLAPQLPVVVRQSPGDALDAAWQFSPRIVVAGSMFLLGDVMKEIG